LGLLLAIGVVVADRLPYLFVIGYFGAILGGLASLIVGDVRKWLLGITFLDASILLDAYPGFSTEIARLGTISGFSISITTLVLPMLYGMWAVELIVTKHKPYRRPLLRAAGPLFIYFAGVVISLANATNHLLVQYELFLLVQLLLLMIAMAGFLRTKDDVLFLMPFLALSLAAQCIAITLQRVGFIFPPIVHFATDVSARPYGTFGSSNVAGGFLAFTLVPLISFLFVKETTRFWKLALLPLIGWGLICLVFTQSRGAWIAFSLGFAILLFLGWWRRWISSTLFFTIIAAAALVLALASPIIINRLTADDQGAAAARGPLNEIALNMFTDQPITGIGANNFAVELRNYLPPRLGSEWLYVVHNKYLLVLSETGIVGFAGWFAFITLTVWRAIRLWRLGHRTFSMIGLGLLAAMLGHLSHMLGEIFNARTMVQYLWSYSAIIYAMTLMVEEERAPKLDVPPYLKQNSWRIFRQRD
jgi:O-antigen ligase